MCVYVIIDLNQNNGLFYLGLRLDRFPRIMNFLS